MGERRGIAGLGGFLLASALVAISGAAFSPGAWYAALAKPAWTPPSWLFGPVWTVLYVAMAVAAWRVWRRGGFAGAPVALGLYVAQLALNALWSWLFFGLHRIDLGLADLLTLVVAVAATAAAFRRHDAVAAFLMLPYLAWVAFAAALNLAIWRLA